MAADKSKSFPKLIFVFLPVDWPFFMRKKAVTALAEAAERFGAVVVAVNRPLCPFSTWFRKPHRIAELVGKARLKRVDSALYLFSPRYFVHDLVASRLGLFEKLNAWALRSGCLRLSRRIGMEERSPVVWFYEPQQGYVTRLFGGGLRVMELMDDLADIYGNESREALRMEARFRDSVDLLLCTSDKLLGRFGGGYRRAWRSEHGIDRRTYNNVMNGQAQIPPEIESLNRPRIGYTGLISQRIDWDLVLHLARLRPQWNFIFVGSLLDQSIRARTAPFANIHFTGWYDHDLMPGVLRGFDIGIIPYRDNDFFRYVNPLKFYEFAAAGVRTVSSNLEELSRFPDELVRIVPKAPEAWIAAIESFLESDGSAARRIGAEITGGYIWEDLADQLLARIRDELC